MIYRAYDTFIDYLFSTFSKETAYGDLRAYLVNDPRATYQTFIPPDSAHGGIALDSVKSLFLSSERFDYPSARVDARPEISNSNGMYSETDKTYEEVFNIPAYQNLDKSTFIDSFVKKAQLTAALHEDEMKSGSYDALQSTTSFKKKFDEAEYDMYHTPMEFLNADMVSVKAQDIEVHGKSLNIASGCLLAVLKEDTIYPIGYINFEGVAPCSKYALKFDPQGFLQLT